MYLLDGSTVLNGIDDLQLIRICVADCMQIQVSCYVVLLAKSPKRKIDDLRLASVIFEPKSTDDNDILSMHSGTQDYTSNEENGVLEAFYGKPVSYAISSIAVAVFLVVAFAGADLRGSWALVQTRGVYNVTLGLTIFASFVLVVMSSMSALFFLANDDVSFIVGAAAVLFISDLVSTALTVCPSNLDVVRHVRSLLLCYHR